MNSMNSQSGDPNENGEFNVDDVSPDFLKLLEATVLAAGQYVVPSDNLRPHTLEAARDLDSDRKGTYKLTKFILAIAVCVCVSLPVFDRMTSWRESVSSPTSAQIYEIAKKKNIGIDWGLMEAFRELRQSQASRLGHGSERKVRD